MHTITATPTLRPVGDGLSEFERTTAVERLDDTSFHADLDLAWSSLRGVHGGYTAAVAVRAATEFVPGRPVRTIAASFLRPGRVGPVDIEMRTIRAGRTLSSVEAWLTQDDRTTAIVRMTMASPVDGPVWGDVVTGRPRRVEDCVSFTPPPEVPHFRQANLLIDPGTIPTGDALDARIAGHVQPLEPQVIDAAWLTMIGDWFPPAAFRRLMPPSGGVSVDYTVHVHRELPIDPDRWIEGVFVASSSRGGIALEHGTLATPDGVAVAETFHTRWTA